MHPLLAAYNLAGGNARTLGETLGVPHAITSAWMRTPDDAVPSEYLVRIEAAAAEQVNRRLAELRTEAAGDSDPFRKRSWREGIRDLDRAHWLVFGISLYEFLLRVFVNLAKAEGNGNGHV